MKKAILRAFKFVVGLLAIGILFLIVMAGILPLPGDIPVLMYHFTGSEEDASRSGNILTLKSFEKQMKMMKDLRYRPISLEAYEAIRKGQKKPMGREVLLTFDDGNESYLRDFLPVLSRYGFPSSVFLVSGSVKNHSNGSMDEAQVREVMKNPLVTLAAHSRNHPFLTEINPEELVQEVSGSKLELEELFGRPIHYFSYPFGDFNSQVVEVVKAAGYRLAFSTSPKKLKDYPEDLYSVTRVKMSRSCDNPVIFAAMTSGVYHHFKQWRQSLKAEKLRASSKK